MSDIFTAIYGLCNRVKKLILENKTVTENGVYGPGKGFDAIGTMVVDIPEPVLQEKTATENGDVTADEGYAGLFKVKVDVDIPKTIIEPLTVTENGVYESKIVTATELFDGANCVYDIPVELEDGTVLNFMKASKISSLLLASDDPNYKIDMQFSYYGDAVSINCPIGEVLEVDPDFLYDADGNLSIDYKIFNLNGLNNQFPFTFTEDLSKLALDVRDASRLAGTPFEGKFESGYVYFSDRLSQIPDISNWRVYITAPGFKEVDGYYPITVDVLRPYGIYLQSYPKTEYKVGEELDVTGGVLAVLYEDEDYNETVSLDSDRVKIYGFYNTVGTHILRVEYPGRGRTPTVVTTYQITVSE